jgi:acyl-CoA thioester hydrolase
MTDNAPFASTPLALEREWIDYNGHLNMAYYGVLFDRAADQAFEVLGISADYVRERHLSVYTAEFHVCYLRELHLEDRVQGTFHIIDHDEKRIHFYQELRHVDGWLSATAEVLSLHVDRSGPRVAPFAADILPRIEAMARAHAKLERPARVGRTIGIRRKSA